MNDSSIIRRSSVSGQALKVILIFVGLLLLLAVGGFLYIWFSGGTNQPSTPINAPALQVNGTARLFSIAPDQSEVRFVIKETLMGQPKTVVGLTRELAGNLAVDFDNPQNSKVGVFRINVKTLQTDNEFRNRALRGQILLAIQPEFEFATFVPRQIQGLPASIALGEAFTFQIVGDLTVRGTSREVTFATTVMPANRNRIEGQGQATIRYKDFDITIPDAPGVASISDEVRLEIYFVALPASQ